MPRVGAEGSADVPDDPVIQARLKESEIHNLGTLRPVVAWFPGRSSACRTIVDLNASPADFAPQRDAFGSARSNVKKVLLGPGIPRFSVRLDREVIEERLVQYADHCSAYCPADE